MRGKCAHETEGIAWWSDWAFSPAATAVTACNPRQVRGRGRVKVRVRGGVRFRVGVGVGFRARAKVRVRARARVPARGAKVRVGVR